LKTDNSCAFFFRLDAIVGWLPRSSGCGICGHHVCEVFAKYGRGIFDLRHRSWSSNNLRAGLPMPSYRTSISINSRAERIWHTLSNVVAWPQWLPTVGSVRALDQPSLKMGNRYAVLQPKLRPVIWTVTQLKPPCHFQWQARSPGMLMVADHVIEKQSSTQSLVTLEFSFAGFLGVPIGLIFRSITERYLAQEAAALKANAEKE
jgi:Polyketide cyclase / dehydrase and lipid transport